MTHAERIAEVLRYRRDDCSVGRTLEVLGERWTMVVLREAFFGVRRFEDFLATVGCARNVLSDRLATLVAEGVLRREPYRDEGQRERMQYRLTEKGLEIFPILMALLAWGDKHLTGRAGPPLRVEHRGCGAAVHVEVRCAAGHGPLGPRETTPVPTKAAGRRGASRPRTGGL
ncbi:MAG: helix-turn-helix transcriptional regulator [Myxococcales bacterium]|nr:helix-turn-helix transcriptional regulator [Myxococcales bacterium]